jgi:hypothetical protein
LKNRIKYSEDESGRDPTQQHTRKTLDNPKQTPPPWQQNVAIPNRRKADHREIKRRFKIAKEILRVKKYCPKSRLKQVQEHHGCKKHDHQHGEMPGARVSLEIIAPAQQAFCYQQDSRHMNYQTNGHDRGSNGYFS